MVVAALVCAAGIYASLALAAHAHRARGPARLRWSLVAVVASGCTAWATHFIVLLAFDPGMPAAFEPVLTIVSMICAIVGIGTGVLTAIRYASKPGTFAAGLIVGLGALFLHYIGQAAYAVQGIVDWNLGLILFSVLAGLPLAGVAMLCAVSRNRVVRRLAAPLLLSAIALMHFCGMASMRLRFDPTVALPGDAITPQAVTPLVAGVSLALLVLAIVGLQLDLAGQARLRRQRQRLRTLADVTFEGLLICEGDVIVTANASAERVSGHAAGALSGAPIRTLLPGLNVADIPEYEEFETELLGVGGEVVPVRVLRREVLLDRRRQTVIAVRDQRERVRLHALAFRDELTGLVNRRRFFDLLASQFASRRACDPPFSVLMMDLDGFKPVNDRFGHPAGDSVLVEVGARLAGAVRADDVVARLGGDEFAILQRGGSDPPEALAVRIVAAMRARAFAVEGRPIPLGISIGIAVAPGHGSDPGKSDSGKSDPGKLMRDADVALYAAKAAGRGGYRRHEDGWNRADGDGPSPGLAA